MKTKVSIFIMAVAFAAATIHAADFLAVGRSMAANGEEVRCGEEAETGWYLVCISKIPTDASIGPEVAAYARLAGKRRIAGFVGGENVAASEESNSSETVANGVVESSESFSQKIKVDVASILRGVEAVGEIVVDGARYVVLAATAKSADASGKMQEAMKGLGPDTVQAMGMARIVDGDVTAAQRAALASAKSAAVEMVLGTVVVASEASMNMNATAKIVSNAGGFIKQFRVTEEEPDGDGGTYRVVIVAEVERNKLMSDYGAFLAQFGNVKFHVADCGDEQLNAMVEDKFQEWNCPLASTKSNADYIVTHKWIFADEDHPMDGRTGTRLTLTIKVYDPNTGKLLWSANNDPRKAVSFVGDRRRRIRNAADMAMKEIHEKIHEKLDRMIGNMVASGREMRMVFDNYSESYAEALETIRAGVGKVPGCGEATIYIDAAKRMATISFKCQNDMDTFRKFMGNVIAKEITSATMRPDTTSADATTWNFSW